MQQTPPTQTPTRRSERSNRGVPLPRLANMLLATMAERAADDPKTYKAAMKLPDADKWIEACKAEVDSLIENKFYAVADRPHHKQTVTSKWVFKK